MRRVADGRRWAAFQRSVLVVAIGVLSSCAAGAVPVSTPTVTPTATPTVTPTFQQLAFVSDRDGSRYVYLMDGDGSHQRRLLANKSDEPAWSPDGQHLAFICSELNLLQATQICTVDADGLHHSHYLSDTPSSNFAPAWSPDGQEISFIAWRDGSAQLYVMSTEGSGPVNLTGTRSGSGSMGYSWSPDGKRIAFMSLRDNAFEIYAMNADGSGVVRLTHSDAHPRTLNDQAYAPAWSPDGKTIAFLSSRDQPDGSSRADIYLMDSDGSTLRRLTRNGLADALSLPLAWSPNGKRIAFSADDGKFRQIFTVDAQGNNLQQLTNTQANNLWPAWRPLR